MKSKAAIVWTAVLFLWFGWSVGRIGNSQTRAEKFEPASSVGTDSEFVNTFTAEMKERYLAGTGQTDD